MKKTKLIITLVLVLAVVAAGLYAAYKYTNVLDFLKRNPLTIEKTANVVEEVKKIGEFTSSTYYEEMALRGTKKVAGVIGKRTNEVILIAKGRVRAGFDLGKLKEGDIVVDGDTLKLTLPPVEVFDIITNPSDYEIEYRDGNWTDESLKQVKVKGRKMLEKNALEFGILQKAEESGLKRLETLFQTFGFNTVLLTVSKPSADPAATEAVVTETANSLPTSTDSTLLSE